MQLIQDGHEFIDAVGAGMPGQNGLKTLPDERGAQVGVVSQSAKSVHHLILVFDHQEVLADAKQTFAVAPGR